MNLNRIFEVKVGDSVDQVQRTLDILDLPTKTSNNGRDYISYKFESVGVNVFFNDDLFVKSILIGAPCNASIRGVTIGMTQEQVVRAAGKPTRYWPVHDGVDRWLYDGDDFMRVDFDPEDNLVRRIVR
jgi:hypothetical protein